ncbi:MAG: hypothetical protein N2319_09145 [Candidatus Kapabacteria bacterium]|nr:hypothetical protein [Candidatus Kapabacteria bacterium]
MVLFLLIPNISFSQELINLKDGCRLNLSDGAVFSVNGSININSGAVVNQSGNGTIRISENLINNGQFIGGTGLVLFFGNGNSILTGIQLLSSYFYNITLNKDNPTNILFYDANDTLNGSLILTQGIFRFDNNTNRILRILGDITVSSNGTFDVLNSGTNRTHNLFIAGNITNNNVFDLNTGSGYICNTTFIGSSNSNITGSGGTTDFNEITTNKSSQSNEVFVNSSNFSALNTGFLTLNGGTFHLGGNFNINQPFFLSASYSIPSNSGFWLDNPNAVVSGQNGNASLSGLLRISNGTMTVGTAATNHLLYSSGSQVTIEGGTLNIAGRFSRDANANSTVNYTQTGGLIALSTVGQSTATDRGAFDIGNTGSTFNWSGGIIDMQMQSSNTSTPNGDYIVLANGGTVTGGTLRIIAAAATQTIRINTTRPIGELLMIGTNNPIAILNTNSLTVLGDITIAGTGAGRLNSNNLNITIGGNWINNSATDLTAFTGGTSRVIFNSGTNQTIGGSATTTFSHLEINKSAGRVILNRQTVINNNLYLRSNPAILDISTFDIEFSTNSIIYSDNGTSSSIDPGSGFSANKCILYSQTGTAGGWIRRNRTGNISTPTPFRFPVGTNGVYTPAEIIVNTATVLSGAYIQIKPIPQEQPNVQLNDVSLKKYWILNKNNITFTDPPSGSACDVKLYYDETEVFGSEGNYRVLVYQPPWLIDPGTSSVVDFNTNLIYSERVRNAQFNGDWTAGEQEAAFAKYYSIANGNYNDPNSWSKINFGGPVSNTAPSLATDRVFIGDGKTITLTANTPNANLIEVQNTGRFLTQTFTVNGDTFRLAPGGTLGIGDAAGITTGASGNIRTTSRQFDTAGVYLYNGSGAQSTGNALPNRVRSLITQKPAADVLTLSNNVVIGDSLIINSGILSLGTRTANAENPNRTFIMRGGEIRIGLEFPENYSPPTFTAGTVNFNGSVAFTVPSSGSTPGVLQYNNLTISGNKQYASITFANEGEIRIANVFDISSCTFTPFATDRFLTSGSTISFNGSGNQNIPRTSGTGGANYELSYFNLKLAGSGTKTLAGTVNHQVNNNVIIESGSTFSLGTLDLTVRGNWINNGGNFINSSRAVTFTNTVALTQNTITSLGIPFHNTIFNGPGAYLVFDSMTVNNLLQISTGGILNGGTSSIRVNGNWTNNNGTFNAGTGNVYFGGGAVNTITNTNGESFYNLIINKTAATVNLAANTNISVSNNLVFNSSGGGHITFTDRPNQFVTLLGTAIRQNLGHIDWNLRLFIPSGAVSSAFFPIGRGASYRPLFLTLNGSGGSAGLLQAQDSIYQTTPTGLNAAQYVQERWALSIPSGSTYALGSRTADIVVTFINPTDIRGGANPLLFETRLWNGSTWTKPTTGNRTTTTTQSLGYTSLSGTFWLVVGPPTVLSFYSIANGNWNSASSWSTARYGGEPSAISPTTPSNIYIGDGKTITLNVNYTTSAGDSVIVETAGPSGLAGRLNLETNVISGAGNFALRSGGILAIANTAGIMASGGTGNIQTSIRNFNEGTHNNGNFIYYGSAAQSTGSGLPSIVNTLISNNPTSVSLTNDVQIRDSLFIQVGTLNSNGRDITIGGNWRNNGTFTAGTRTVTFNGNGIQRLIRTLGETFYNLVINKPSSYVLLEDSLFVSNQLTFTSGIIDARTNNRFVSIANGGNVSRTSGHIDGELRMFVSSGNPSPITYHIGTSNAYNPAILDLNGTGGTGGHVSMIVYGTNHPNINNLPLTLDTAKNVQRYWKLFRPLSSPFVFGTRSYDLTLQFLNPDDLRGGADPLNFVIRRWDGSWNTTTNGTRTSTTTQAVNITTFGTDFVVGEPFAVTRVFYTRLSGVWNNSSQWSYEGYGGAPADDYPSTSSDVVFIGNGNTIILDQDRTLASVTIEDVNGQGTLDFNNFNLLGNTINQFTLKSGGILRITSPDGITTSGATGNVRTAVRNYNFNNHFNGFFIYTGNNNQNTGNGIPDTLGYLEIANTGTDPNNLVTLSKNIRVRNNLIISSGRLNSNNFNIILDSNWVNNSGSNAFIAGTGTVIFEKNRNQSIGGNSITQFNNLSINKTANHLSLDTNITVNGTLNFISNSLLKINDNDLTLGPNASISGSPFSAIKMIQSDGLSSSGSIIKEYTNGTGVTRNFTFPVGVGNLYNEAIINIGGDFNNAFTSLKIFAERHPNRISGNDNILGKYWRITTQGITNINPANTSLSFLYQASDVNGNQARYIPARFNSGWEVNLGTSRSATPSPITIQGETGLTGDWTAGEPNSFFTGRIFYSRLTNVNWNSSASWSNISHSGSAAAYWPGQIFERDTVLIADTDNIRFNQTGGVRIDSLRIGGTLAGSLLFDRAVSPKSLTILRNITVENNGTIADINTNATTDTLIVFGNFTNNNTTVNAVDLRPADNRFTFLVFSGSGNSIVSGGTGANGWRLSNVRLSKTNGLNDSLINLSTTFSRALNIANTADRRFVLGSGIYKHNNSDTAILCADGAGAFTFGTNSGIHLISGGIRFNELTNTNSNTTIRIDGGLLYFGNANNEHFLYAPGTKFSMTGGEARVAACFSRTLPQSYCDFNMSGGNLRVLTVGTSGSYGYYGFDLSNSTCIFNWSGGTIVITRNSADVDYKVGAATYSVTGGTLQIGETGINIVSGANFALGSPTAPLWNLYVKYTRYNATDYSSAMFWDGDFTILNNVIIDPDGCLDLNCNSFTLGGHFINRGNFTTDGIGWNNNVGARKVTFNGTGDQIFANMKAIVTHTGPSYNNQAFFDVEINKPSGKIILDSAGVFTNSNLTVRNTLKFSADNKAVIDARTNNRFVFADFQTAGDLAQVQRIGSGHINGTLRREVSPGTQTVEFIIGTDTAYTPAILNLNGTDGTDGPLDMIVFNNVSPAPTDPPINLSKYITRRWRISRPTTSAFALGTRTYNLTTTFLPQNIPTGDVPTGASWTNFEHFVSRNGGAWNQTTTGTRTTNSTQSINHSVFDNTSNDFIIGERTSVDFYSIANGNWTSPSTWSTVGYGGPPETTLFPNSINHQVYIGDGKTVTLNTDVNVKSVTIENVGSGPGHLNASINFITGETFSLNDSCIISTAHQFGLRATLNSGSIRTNQRYYGRSNYIFNSSNQTQNTGDGVPIGPTNRVLSLTVNNTAPDSASRRVLLTNNITCDSNIFILSGFLDAGSRIVQLNRNLIINANSNYIPSLSTFELINPTLDQYITLNNSWGTLFHNFYVSKAAGKVIVDGSSNVDIFIKNRLRFSSGNTASIDVRTNNRRVILTSTGFVEREGQGYVDGRLRKPIPIGPGTYTFEIGNENDYTPAVLTLTGSGGLVGSIEAENIKPLPNEPFSGNRMDQLQAVPRYWSLIGYDNFSMGGRLANVNLQFPPSELSSIEISKAVVRRKSIPAETPVYKDRRNLTWNLGLASVELAPAENKWIGIGEFYIGNKAQRIFYSRQTGNWDDNNSWSFTGLGGPPVPLGEFPNSDWNYGIDETEVRDSVVIGNGNSITLGSSILPELAYLEILANGNLIINQNSYIQKSSIGSSVFALRDEGTLTNRTNLGIEPGSSGLLRFDDLTRTFEPNANYVFSGALNQTFGSAFPSSIGNLTINTDNNTRIVSTNSGILNISGNLNVLSGQLRPLNNSVDFRLAGNMTVNGVLNFTIDPSGNNTTSIFKFSGSSTSNQVISGSGTLIFHNLIMNRTNPQGIVELNMNASIRGSLNFLEGANPNNQILSLGTNSNLRIENSNPNSIQNYQGTGILRYIRTSNTSGLLIRNVTLNQNYDFPLGSYDDGNDNYTPGRLITETTGNNGFIGMRVSRGSSNDPATFQGHLFLPTDRTNSYIKRYWAIDSVTTTIKGQLRFNYSDNDVAGDENLITSIGRWRPTMEGSPGSWRPIYGNINISQNYFETFPSFQDTNYRGDWTIANIEAFRRLFFSRQSGNWTDLNSWTASRTHSGPIFGDYPQEPLDSVNIGGGSLGVGNHIITLNIPSITIAGIAVGRTQDTTGTLDCGPNIIYGENFTLDNYSTLAIGSPQGITLSGLSGNIQTNSRNYTVSGLASFIYKGNSDQSVGNGLPTNIRNLTIENSGPIGDNTVTLIGSLNILSNLYINNGRLDLQNFTANNNSGTGTFSISSNASLRIGGTNNLLTSINNYTSYLIDPNSTIEFYGGLGENQTISSLPINLTSGLGNVILNNSGTKFVVNPLLIRGNLFNSNGALLQNNVGVDALQVLGSIINSASINNDGVIEIGQ